MASILPGYQYDIFISYRHNDNLDGWVTHFVESLEKELLRTVKEPVSIYFDKNPHDGLLETHNVDKSLEGKLKCLIFIPILSNTYFDTNSFAWQHEFCAFNKIASNDSHGIDIVLPNGNVTSRILPVIINEPGNTDKNLYEKETGKFMRGIDFVFKAHGVNRPLTPEDKRNENANKVYYPDQINKLANAVRDILYSMKNSDSKTDPAPSFQESEPSLKTNKKTVKTFPKWVYLFIGIITVLSVLGWIFTRSDSPSSDTNLERTLAVIPFQSLIEDDDNEYFADGLSEELINTLSALPSLKVTGRTSSFYFKGKDPSLEEIQNSLNVNYIVDGSVRRGENSLRINVQLTRVDDGFNLWSEAYDEPVENVLSIQTSMAENIAKALDIVLDEKNRVQMKTLGVRKVEAFTEFQKGYELFRKAHNEGNRNIQVLANDHFQKAVDISPEFSQAYAMMSDLYCHYLLDSTNYSELDKEYMAEMESQMESDLENALKYTKDEGSALIYESDMVLFSDNWSKIPKLLAGIVASETCDRPNWIQNIMLHTSTDRDELGQFLENRIQCDPFREDNYGMAVMLYLFSHNNNRAMELVNNGMELIGSKGQTDYLKFLKTRVLLAQNKPDESEAIFLSDPGNMRNIPLSKAMYLAFKGDSSASFQLWENEKNIEYSEMGIVDELLLNAYNGRIDVANQYAAIIDNTPFGPLKLIISSRECLCGSPFDINVTPNFKKRIEEAGLSWPPPTVIQFPLKTW